MARSSLVRRVVDWTRRLTPAAVSTAWLREADRRRFAAALLAAGGTVTVALVRLVLNSPLRLPGVEAPAIYSTVAGVAVATPALAAILLGLGSADEYRRVGLLAIGSFGLLSLVARAAVVPATWAVVAGGWLAGAPSLSRVRDHPSVLVLVVLLAGTTVTLAGVLGFRPALLRPAGTAIVLFGVATTPLLATPSRVSALVGLGTGVLVAVLGVLFPFIMGAIDLIVLGVVGVPHLFVVAAIAGGATTVTAGLSQDRPVLALAGLLLLAAGVPASLPRALAVVLAVALLSVSFAQPRADHHDDKPRSRHPRLRV